jgi:hypothetical protein
VGFYFSRKNDHITSFASSLWWIFSVLCAIAVLWTALLLIGAEMLSFIVYAFLVGFVTCLVFLSVKENIKLF